MAIATMSGMIEGLSPIHSKQMLHLKENLLHDSLFPSRGLAEFEYDPPTSSSLLVSMDDLQRQCTANGNDPGKKILPEAIEVSTGLSDGFSEIAHIMQGNVASYPSSQHLLTAHESFECGLSGEFGSLGFNEPADFWGDFRLYSHEMAIAAAMLPLQKPGWNEGSTSCTTGGDLMTNSASTEHGRPGGQPSCSYSIPTLPESSAGQGFDLECPRALDQERSSHSPWPVAPSAASVDVKSPSIVQGSSGPSTPEDVTLCVSSSCQPEFSKKTQCLQPSTCRKSRFHSQPLGWSGAKDVLLNFSDTATDSKILHTEHRFPQQAPTLLMSRSHNLHRRREPGECRSGGKPSQFTSEDLKPRKLKQKANEESPPRSAPRKYQRRQAVNGMDYHKEANSVPTPLDHVQRERQRRDLMTSKIAALELLLPKSSKRDRVSVVYDTIHLLKRLERDVKVLQKRYHAAKLLKASSAPSSRYRQSIPKPVDCSLGMSRSSLWNGVVIQRLGAYMKPVVTRTHPTWGRSGNSGQPQGSSMITSTKGFAEHNSLDKGSVFVEFHVLLDDTGTIHKDKLLKCRCRVDYLSKLMGVVDQFQLDVTSCNITKLSGYFLCIIGLKTLRTKETTSATQFAARLQSVVNVDIAAEAVEIS